MKIIFASKFYYRRGGLESYMFKTKELLESKGHTVIPFSTNFSENYETEYSKFFCTYYNLSKSGYSKRSSVNSIKATKNMFFNREAYNNMKKLIAQTKPDIVQGFGISKHITYSIFKAAKEAGVKTVMRLSDYALLCPCSTAIDGHGEICSDFVCSKNDFSRILSRKCIHDSLLASVAGKFEVKINIMLDAYKKYVDYFIAPSRFIRNIFIEHFKISPQRIHYLPIFIDLPGDCSSESGDYFLFAGRLSSEKGVYTLLRAFSKDKKNKIIIAGTGPKESELRKYAHQKGINAEFIGFQDYKKLKNIIKRSKALIIPSEWYENSPNIILEAYALGKPVIGSNVGGIPELIEDGKTGFLFEMGSIDELADKVKIIQENRNLAIEMGNNAKRIVSEKYSPDEHYDQLINIYKSVIKKKVLLVNNFYYNRGGDCTYLFSLKNILEQNNHNVVIFSMEHPQNLNSSWSKYFVNYINYDEELKQITFSSVMKVATRTIYFLKAKKMISKLIREENPDIVHLQNIHHHITPSILYPLKNKNIPVVWTLHDYQLICPNISFLAHGKICERCKNKKYYWPVIIKCKKNSFAASLMSAIEIIIHNVMRIDRLVDMYIAPSNFLKSKFIEFGFKREKVKHISHFASVDVKNNIDKSEDYYLFIGRISEEKGVKTLIEAAVKLNLSKLKIVGDGPLLQDMINYARVIDNNNIVEFVGHKSREEVDEIIKKCKFLVIPSEWYETSGLVIIEAFSYGKTVVGSRVGGIPELIRDNETGLTFEMGNVQDLSSKIKYMLNNPDEVGRMGKNAREFTQKELDSERYYKELIKIYDDLFLHHT